MQSKSNTELQPAVRTIQPHLSRAVMMKLTAFVETKLDEGVATLSGPLRKLHEDWKGEDWALELRATALVLADLIDQGWAVMPSANQIHLLPPGMKSTTETLEIAKARIRRSLQIGQERQLLDPSVSRFLHRFSSQAMNNKKRSSVLDLVDDGAELSNILSHVSELSDAEALGELRNIISPELEVCDENARCAVTGIKLLDIWRYFRHSWSLEYRSIPGRQLPLLIRNAARPRRPVMGIAMLASPVLRTKPRDNWLGWTTDAFLGRIESGQWAAKASLKALAARIERSIENIRWDDLASEDEIDHPSENVIFRLEQRAAGAIVARSRQLEGIYNDALLEHGEARSQRDHSKRPAHDIDWHSASEDLLFIRKRCEALARLLTAKKVFSSLDWGMSGAKLFQAAAHTKEGQKAIGIALQEVRNNGLASQVADLSVCGAIAPYNTLLGGKLVALAVTSQEATSFWRSKYDQQISIISSQMAGRPIMRSSELKILTTTSLYGLSSSQYNRLRVVRDTDSGIKHDINWEKLELTAGFGTVHLSSATVKALREVSQKAHRARRINNRFGEGTSPRLRQVREGLDTLGIRSDDILHHATPRLFYACSLVPNADKQLFGLHIAREQSTSRLASISEAWRVRWLLNRIKRQDTIEALKQQGPHTLRRQLLPAEVTGQLRLDFLAE